MGDTTGEKEKQERKSNRRYGNWDQERSGGTGGRRGEGDGENNDEGGEDRGGTENNRGVYKQYMKEILMLGWEIGGDGWNRGIREERKGEIKGQEGG